MKASAILIHSGITPFDSLDMRIRKAMDDSRVRRQANGSYRATSACVDPVFGEGSTRKEALRDLWEWCRWLLADPVRISFEAVGRTYMAEVKAERFGGYSVSVPELPGCFTCGDTMAEVRVNVVEAAEGWLECQRDAIRAKA